MKPLDYQVARLCLEFLEGQMAEDTKLLNQVIEEINAAGKQVEVLLGMAAITNQAFTHVTRGDKHRATQLLRQMVAASRLDEALA
jgi:alkyl sulfatase BDS1-like metallo-beta-lactamase superfamily hydrolase